MKKKICKFPVALLANLLLFSSPVSQAMDTCCSFVSENSSVKSVKDLNLLSNIYSIDVFMPLVGRGLRKQVRKELERLCMSYTMENSDILKINILHILYAKEICSSKRKERLAKKRELEKKAFTSSTIEPSRTRLWYEFSDYLDLALYCKRDNNTILGYRIPGTYKKVSFISTGFQDLIINIINMDYEKGYLSRNTVEALSGIEGLQGLSLT